MHSFLTLFYQVRHGFAEEWEHLNTRQIVEDVLFATNNHEFQTPSNCHAKLNVTTSSGRLFVGVFREEQDSVCAFQLMSITARQLFLVFVLHVFQGDGWCIVLARPRRGNCETCCFELTHIPLDL